MIFEISNRAIICNQGPNVLRRNLRVGLTMLLLGIGMLLSATIDRGILESRSSALPDSVLDEPTFVARLGRSRLAITANTASPQHETALLAFVSEHFSDYVVQTSFSSTINLSDDWETVSTRLLHVLAATESAVAAMRGNHIKLRGVSAAAETLEARLNILRAVMPDDATIEHDVTIIAAQPPFDSLCRRTFSTLISRPIDFYLSSADIKKSSHPQLDKIIEFAYDCRHLSIAITGHSDATGNASWNQHLSELRAEAVADYLTGGGITADRLIVAGKGSSIPVADNQTIHGRRLNRRIEFELR